MPSLTDSVPERFREILDDRVFSFAQAAQRHFQTNDLVVVLDLRDEAPQLEALPRQRLADANELPLDVRLKFVRPAVDLKEMLGSPEQSFWFLVIYEDEDSDCGAVNVSMMALGGQA